MSYAPLHNHTEYSNLRLKDCTIHINELLDQCKKFNIRNIAITDHESLTGHIEFLEEAEKFNKNNPNNTIKPILGNEIYIVEENADLKEEAHYQGRVYGHGILLSKNKNGHKQLRELSSIAWNNGFYRGKYYTVCIDFSTLKKYVHKGDLVFSTACLGGLLPHYVLNLYKAFQEKNNQLANELNIKIKNYIKNYQDLFGKENFYIELQPNEPNTTQWIYNKLAIKIAEKNKVPTIITCDTHYLRPENAKAHEIFLKSSENDQREISEFYKYTYLMSREEIIELMKDNIGYGNVIKSLDNTLKIADMIEVYDLKMPTQMPVIDLPKSELNGIFKKYLEYYKDKEYKGIKYFLNSDNEYNKAVIYYIEQGFIKKIIKHTHKSKKIQRYMGEINEDLEVLQELELVHNKNFSQYFLVTKKIIDLIWKAGSFVGVARGSAGAFIINYLMDIVDVDAIEANFPYWRFLAKGRLDNPDIDVDSNPLYKQKIMEKIISYFGYDKVLPICTVGTEGSKSAIQSSFRAFGLEPEIAQRISDLIPIDRGQNWAIKDCIFGNEKKDREPIKLIQKYYKQYQEMFDIAMEIEGLINKRSQHASGVLISPTNYLDYNAMMKTPKGVEVSQYCMTESEKCGLIKEDLLYTEYESKLQTCLEFMRKDGIIKGETAKELYQFITPDNLNLEDEKIWKEIFHTGNVAEIFQMEGQVGIEICKKIKPNNIAELSAANSLMRLKSDINVDFVAKQNGFENIQVTDFMKHLFEEETLVDKFLRYKNNPQDFINDTIKCGVPKYYALRIAETLKDTYGVCVSQEDLMTLLMNIFEFNITEAHGCRKAIAKKKPALLEESRLLMLKYAKEKDIPLIVAFYVWLVILGIVGYGFSVVHSYSYSLIGYQGAFLKYYYPLYWHTACLAVNAQSINVDDDEESIKRNKTTDYAKISKAIFDLQQEGIPVNHPNINKSDFSFNPDKDTNTILFALKALDRVGDDIAQQIIDLRPYTSFADFLNKNVLFNIEEYPNRKKLNKNTMSSLIFSNCFEDLGIKKSECIIEYLGNQVNEINSLTTRYLNEIKENKLLPNEFDNFKSMQNALTKIKKFQCEDKKIWKIPCNEYSVTQYIYDYFYDEIKENNGEYISLEKKSVNAKFKVQETELKEWLSNNTETLLNQLKNIRIKQEYQEWTKGKNISDLAFKSMGMYLSDSWLDNADTKYNISNFLDLPLADNNIIAWGKYKGNEYPIFGISQVPLTVIDKESKHKVLIGMTKGAIIKCKMKDNTYDYYSKLFERGNKLILWGYRGRTEDSFTIKLYDSVRKNHIDTHTIIEVV